MKHSPANKFKVGATWALILSFALPVPHVFGDVTTDNVCTPNAWDPQFKASDIPRLCPGRKSAALECKKVREYILNSAAEYKKLSQAECDKVKGLTKRLQTVDQAKSYGEVKSVADSAGSGLSGLLAANQKLQSQIPQQSQYSTSALNNIARKNTTKVEFGRRISKLKSKWDAALKNPKALQGNSEALNDLEVPDADPQFQALERSNSFLNSLMGEEQQLKSGISGLEHLSNQAQAAADKQTTTPPPGDPPPAAESPAGGMLTSMLPLAAPLLGLLATQMNQGEESSVSDPAATPPTDPTIPTGPAGTSINTPAGTKLAGPTNLTNNSVAPPGTKIEQPSSPLPSMAVGSAPYSSDDNESTVSSSPSDYGSGKSRGLASGASASGADDGASGGESNSPGKDTDKEAAAGEEALQSFGGGGALNFAGGAASSGQEENPGMKDILSDMEATVEDAPTGLFADEAEQSNGESGVAPENSESLFPRVSACYLRNLKKGLVMNGLGENLSELGSHQ